jgi:uncharacterized protein
MWEFRNNNTFGAVAFTSYGAFWISFFYYVRYVAATPPPADALTATGIFLAALASTFVVLLVAFALLTLGAFNVSTGLTHAGGYVGLLAAAGAWYVSAAGLLHATWGRVVLPVFPARKS